MITAIHQPHYMPWLGYLDKMAQCDSFIVLDDVQLTESSPMLRNKFIDTTGKELYLTVDVDKTHYHDKKAREILIRNDKKWQKRHSSFFLFNYKKCAYFDEVWPHIQGLYEKPYTYLVDLEMDSMRALRAMFDIQTPLLLQSELNYDPETKNNELLVSLLKCIGASEYLSGNGAKKYMDVAMFEAHGIRVAYQKFVYPAYAQRNSGADGFVPNLSALDMLFNCGLGQSRTILKENSQGKEFA